MLDARLGQLAEELAGVGTERLEVAALALGIHRVHGEAALAAARHAAAHADLAAGEARGHVLEVVLGGPDDPDFSHFARCRAFAALGGRTLASAFSAGGCRNGWGDPWGEGHGQGLTGVRSPASGDLLGGALDDDAPAGLSALWPQVDDPVGGLDHIQVVLDDHHRVARVDEAVQHGQQPANVLEVQPGGRLVEQVQRAAGRPADQLAGQLDPLGLAAGERGG